MEKSFNKYVVNLKNIRHNLLEYKKIDKKLKICAVVKANGYGVGAENVVKSIDSLVQFYAVACFYEAIDLRKETLKPILILNTVQKDCIKDCIKNDISVSISNFFDVKNFCKVVDDKPLKIHLAINTGMNRIGFKDIDKFEKTLKYLKKHKGKFFIEGIYTHIYNYTNKYDTNKQIRIFMQFLKVLQKYFDITKIIKHALSSGASIDYPNFRFDMVRLGIMLYGYMQKKCKLNLKPVLSIFSKVINIKKVDRGEKVGYGLNFIAKRKMTVATVPIGYADGIFRNIAKSGYVIVKNRKCKIIGRICMDMFMIDISRKKIKNYDKVILLGESKNIKIDADTIARWCKTISYEILTSIKQTRFEKVYEN